MGLYDRDYTQTDDSGLSFGGRMSGHPAWLIILGITVGMFFIDAIFFSRSHQLNEWLSVHHDTLFKPWTWWRWGTYSLAHAPGEIQHILFNMIGLYFFGSAIERKLGRGEFTRFYIASVVLGGIIWSLMFAVMYGAGSEVEQARLIGASGGVQAVCILFCFFYPHATILLFFVLPVKAWVAGVMFVAMNLLGAISAGDTTAYEVHLAGIGFAAAYYFGGWNLGAFSPTWLGGLPNQVRTKRPKLKLHDPDKKLAKEATEADRILQKIHDSGESSLTGAERRLLERYSRRMRDRQ